MPTNTYTPIGSVTLATATSEVTFTVPTGYRDLVLVANGQMVSGASLLWIRFNNDSGNNYPRVYMIGNSAGTVSGSSTISYLEAGFNFGTPNTAIFNIMDYSATDKHKTVIFRTGSIQQSEVVAQAARWANTNAINTITITGNGNINSGSTFNLFGIVA